MEQIFTSTEQQAPRIMSAQQCKLVEENRKKLEKVFKRKYHYLIPEKSDIVSVFNEGICLAAMNYDESSESSFQTYAYRWIDGFIKNYLRNVTPHIEDENRNPVYLTVMSIDSLGSSNDEFDDEQLNGEEVIPAESLYDMEARMDAQEQLQILMEGLSDQDRDMLLCKYDCLENMSIPEMAQEMGISERALYKKIENLEYKLARKAEKMEMVS